jgi:HK97 family phage prohead protease
MSTATGEALAVRPMARTVAVDDLHVVDDGDGRTVEAYAAVFDVPSEVTDQDGHYIEQNHKTSFNRTIQHKVNKFGVLFNHGCTVAGTPAGELTMPIGVPLQVQADEKGVFTRTRYLDNPLADSVLKAIKAGALTAQSYSGRFLKSYRTYPGGRGRSALPLITRHEVDMREYGPAIFAQYPEAAIIGSRAELHGLDELIRGRQPFGSDPLTQFVRTLLLLDEEQRLNFLQQFEITTPPTAAEPVTTGTQADPDSQSEDPTGTAAQTEDSREHSRSESASDWRTRLREKRARLGA